MNGLSPSTAAKAHRQVRRPWYRNGSPFSSALVAFWPLDEVSGARRDAIGASALTDNNTVTSAAGITRPLAAEFVIANSESLSAADSPVLSGSGHSNMFGCGWFCPAAVNVTSTVYGKFNTTGNREWQIAQVNADVVFQCSPDGTATANGAITASGVLAALTWVFFMWYYDATNSLIGLSINGGPFATASYAASGGIFNSAASLRIGGQGAGTSYFGGRIQDCGLGKGYVPTQRDAANAYYKSLPNGVQSVEYLGLGREADWSPNGQKIVFDRRDVSNNYQLFTITPNGTSETCLTVPAVSGGPSATVHKGFPAWHPSGNYLVASVEMSSHPDGYDRSLSEPGKGGQCDVWICTADGQAWWQMTSYSNVGHTGVLNPRFSPDGTKLLWARKTGAVSGTAPYGTWDLQLADFSMPGGVPTLGTITTITPGTGKFYESQGFSRDSTKIFFTSDNGGAQPFGPDVFSYTISSGLLLNLGTGSATWDEHVSFAHHADFITWMTSLPYPSYIPSNVSYPTDDLSLLKSEIVVANPDGTSRRQLTHFNSAGFAEYNVEHSVACSTGWNPAGTKIVVTQLLLGANYDLVAGGMMWIINLNGAYALDAPPTIGQPVGLLLALTRAS